MNDGEPHATPEQTPAASDASTLYRGVGAIFVVLVFFASAVLTTSYLSAIAETKAAQAATAKAATTPDPFTSLQLQAESAYVLDLATGRTIFAHNPDVQLPLASLTKIALALVVSEALSSESVITIPYTTAPSNKAERLLKGERWRTQDIITYTLVASSNDGADILAQAADADVHAVHPIAPEGSAVLWRMNDLARALGLTNTYFLNDTGLDLSPTQAGAYGSAHDVATLLAYAASTAPSVFAGTARGGLLLTSTNGIQAAALNTNHALGSIPGLVMGKTGYTDLAGGNLGIVFEAGPAHPIVAVVLHSTEEGRFDDMKKLVDATLDTIGKGY